MEGMQEFHSAGFAGPFPVWNDKECARLLRLLTKSAPRQQVWTKAAAAKSPAYYRAASDPKILALVRAALGEDIILWGAHLVRKAPGATHPFHTDIESASPEGGFVSVWIGLENTGPAAGLRFLAASHRFGITIQEANSQAGLSRGDSSDETVLAAARDFGGQPEIVQPAVRNGVALLFDGRIWHGSHNTTPVTRTALLLQYAKADRPVRIPDGFDWPIRFKPEPRPPVLLLSGRATAGINNLVRPPAPKRRANPVGNAAHLLPFAPAEAIQPFASVPHFRGRTSKLSFMDGHSSILAPTVSPHPLHAHAEEELIIIVSGEAELITADDLDGANAAHTRVTPGDFAYYPAFQPHTLVNSGASPVLYTMLKWRDNQARASGRAQPLSFFQAGATLALEPDPKKRNRGALFNVETKWLDRLHCHVSVAAPGVAYDAHADPYDVAIVLFSGAIETLGRTVAAPALLYHPAGHMHGMKAVGHEAARYLVFELDRKRLPWRRVLESFGAWIRP
jgi:mannose-6-phosphate isomerase-like protein (cupin superfamily)